MVRVAQRLVPDLIRSGLAGGGDVGGEDLADLREILVRSVRIEAVHHRAALDLAGNQQRLGLTVVQPVPGRGGRHDPRQSLFSSGNLHPVGHDAVRLAHRPHVEGAGLGEFDRAVRVQADALGR